MNKSKTNYVTRDTALRDVQIQLELKITRVRPHFAVRLPEGGFGAGADLDPVKNEPEQDNETAPNGLMLCVGEINTKGKLP